LSSLPMFQAQPANVVSYDIFSRAVNLPSYHDLSHDDIARVVRVTRECIGRSPE
jgi:perosamine synthetase